MTSDKFKQISFSTLWSIAAALVVCGATIGSFQSIQATHSAEIKALKEARLEEMKADADAREKTATFQAKAEADIQWIKQALQKQGMTP